MSVGQTVIISGSRSVAHKLVDAAPNGAVMTVKPPTRTNEQNALMWSLLSTVSRAKPEGRSLRPDQWKALFMDAVGRETKNAAFLAQWEPGLDGEGVVNLGHRSSRLSKSDMSDLIEKIYEYGARHEVEWSDDETKEARDAA